MNNEANKITIVEARERLAEEIFTLTNELDDLNAVVKNRIYYFDKNLLEFDEFNSKAILIVGNISVGTENMESDDYCDFAACIEIRTAYVDEAEFCASVAEFKKEILNFAEEARAAENIENYINEVSKKQTEEATQASQEFSKAMKKNRIKLIIGIVATVLLVGGVVLIVSLIK